MRIAGEWSAITGHRVFKLVGVEDSRAMLGVAAAWGDLDKIASFPVMPTEEVTKLLTRK
jgi:hypothetical protein